MVERHQANFGPKDYLVRDLICAGLGDQTAAVIDEASTANVTALQRHGCPQCRNQKIKIEQDIVAFWI